MYAEDHRHMDPNAPQPPPDAWSNARRRARTCPPLGGRTRNPKRDAPSIWELQQAMADDNAGPAAARPISGISGIPGLSGPGLVTINESFVRMRHEEVDEVSSVASTDTQRTYTSGVPNDDRSSLSGSWPRVRKQKTPTGAMNIWELNEALHAAAPETSSAADEDSRTLQEIVDDLSFVDSVFGAPKSAERREAPPSVKHEDSMTAELGLNLSRIHLPQGGEDMSEGLSTPLTDADGLAGSAAEMEALRELQAVAAGCDPLALRHMCGGAAAGINEEDVMGPNELLAILESDGSEWVAAANAAADADANARAGATAGAGANYEHPPMPPPPRSRSLPSQPQQLKQHRQPPMPPAPAPAAEPASASSSAASAATTATATAAATAASPQLATPMAHIAYGLPVSDTTPLSLQLDGGIGSGSLVPTGRASARNGPERKEWTTTEDEIIKEGVQMFGCRWRRIAAQLPGRSDDAVRNRWNRLKEMSPGMPMEEPPVEAAAAARRRAQSAQAKKLPGSPASVSSPASASASEAEAAALRSGSKGARGEDGKPERVSWTRAEDAIIVSSVQELGHKWFQIAQRLPGRTDHAIRNRFHRLQAMVSDVAILQHQQQSPPSSLQFLPPLQAEPSPLAQHYAPQVQPGQPFAPPTHGSPLGQQRYHPSEGHTPPSKLYHSAPAASPSHPPPMSAPPTALLQMQQDQHERRQRLAQMAEAGPSQRTKPPPQQQQRMGMGDVALLSAA